MKNEKRRVIYRFQKKVFGGPWEFIKDKNGIPISITTDRGQNAVLHIFKRYYPSIADMYVLGETLIAVPDMDATERKEEYERKRKEEALERAQGMWWNND